MSWGFVHFGKMAISKLVPFLVMPQSRAGAAGGMSSDPLDPLHLGMFRCAYARCQNRPKLRTPEGSA